MAIYDTDTVHACALPDCTAPTGTDCDQCRYWLTMSQEMYEEWLDWCQAENGGQIEW